MEFKTISSTQNPLIKTILRLQEKSRERKREGLFFVEGLREIEIAFKSNYELETLLICDQVVDGTVSEYIDKQHSRTIKINKVVHDKLSRRGSSEGVSALFKLKDHSLDSITFQRENPLILIAEAPEKPGNIGALLRTADAANLDAVIIANAQTDMYNPNIIRSSVGSVFTVSLALATTEEIIEFLNSHAIAIYCASLEASKNYHSINFEGAAAIVVGTEATGLTSDWLNCSTQNIKIPMQGQIDSLNVSVSAGILIYEAKRQRKFS